MNKKNLAIVFALVFLVVFACSFKSAAKPSKPECRVTNLSVTEQSKVEPVGLGIPPEITWYRWVRSETIRCGNKSITIVDRGEWETPSPFRTVR